MDISNISSGGIKPLNSSILVTPDGRSIQSSTEPQEKVDIGNTKEEIVSFKPKTQVYRGDGKTLVKTLSHDEKEFKDGYDTSRDITGLFANEGKPDQPYHFQVNVNHLRIGAEMGNLDVYTLVSFGDEGRQCLVDNIPGSTSMPWNLAIGTYDANNQRVFDSKGRVHNKALQNIQYNSVTGGVSFDLDKNLMRELGWKDGDPIKIQVFTAKDHVKEITDSLDDPYKKPWVNNNRLTRFIDTAKPESLIAPRNETWADDSIYFIMTDRFANGDKSNDFNVKPGELERYQGGDLQGVIDKLDYVKELGATTIWITPVQANQTDFVNSSGYHGYWPVDFYDVDKHLGNMDKFKEMVDKAHEKGLKIVLDIPLNHVAWEHPFYKDPAKKDWFHHIGDIQNWNDDYWKENGSMYGLPDLAQENPEVYNYLMDACKFWIKEGKIDGFRLDAVSHVPKWFWDKFSSEIRQHAGPDFFLVGEVVHGDPGKVGSYQTGGMNSLFDMPLYYSIRDSIAFDGSMKWLANKVSELESRYENPSEMASVLDNHDTDRFITMAGNAGKEKLKLALALITTLDRIPAIYYGTEQAMTGRLEKFGVCGPENRDNMKFGKDPDMEDFTKKLLNARKNSIALGQGSYLEMWQDDHVFAYSRIHPDQEAVVILNNGYRDSYREIPLRKETDLKPGSVLHDVISGQDITVSNDGKIKINLKGKQPMVLLPTVKTE